MIWRAVPGYEDLYDVSDTGQVKSFVQTLKGRCLRARPRGAGYRAVVLGRKKHKQERYVHDLVLLAFRGTRPTGMQACHENGDPTDNALNNLRWDTPSNNCLEKWKHGRMVPHKYISRAKLTSRQVRCIRERYQAGASKVFLSRRYAVSWSTIHAVCEQQSWRHVL